MIKLVIFDLDGVLVDTTKLHYDSLNLAFAQYNLSFDVSKYDGLPTKEKLKKLNLPEELQESICAWKQTFFNKLSAGISYDEDKVKLIRHLKNLGCKVYVASNAVRETVDSLLKQIGVYDLIDHSLSSEDVVNCKPHPEIYLRCFLHAGVAPEEALIFEDSAVGIKAAMRSGANVKQIEHVYKVCWETLSKWKHVPRKHKWKDDGLNVLIPMAGLATRFGGAIKPLLKIKGKPMIQLMLESLNIEAKYTYIIRKEHYYQFETLLNVLTPNCNIICVDKKTEGAACTTLLAKDYIDDRHLLIANSDQVIDYDVHSFLYEARKYDGSILTFHSTEDKWSYVDNEIVTRVAEKEVISNLATVGVYYWDSGTEYMHYAEQMIRKNIRVNDEFYVAPVYNEAIADGKKITTFLVDKMIGLGTPEDVDKFNIEYT